MRIVLVAGALCLCTLVCARYAAAYDTSTDDRIRMALSDQCIALGAAYNMAVTTTSPAETAIEQRVTALIAAKAPQSEIDAVMASMVTVEVKVAADLNAKQQAYKRCEADFLRLDKMQADEAERRLRAYQAMTAPSPEVASQPPEAVTEQPDTREPPKAYTGMVSTYEPAPKPQVSCLGVIPMPNINLATKCPAQ